MVHVRVVRTFAFLDLCGFTTYTEANGDQAAVAVLADLRALLRAETADHGVRVTKWLGDGAMLSGTEAPEVLRCCVHVREQLAAVSPLPLRGGIAEGPVIMFEGTDYIGGAVNVAARLCEHAQPNQLLVEATVAAEQQATIVTRPLPSVLLSGITAPVEIGEILGVRPLPVSSGTIAAA